jgi:hypothetical protein
MAELMVPLIRQGELPDQAWSEHGPTRVGAAGRVASMTGSARNHRRLLSGERARSML